MSVIPSGPVTVALLGGEGIGPEVVDATAQVLSHVLPQVVYTRPIHGEPALAEFGTVIPEPTKLACQNASAVLFGATWKHCNPVLLYLRWGLETFANLRPAKSRPGLSSPLKKEHPLDLLTVRENLEGEYPAREGELSRFNAALPDFRDVIQQAMPREGLFSLRITTEVGCRRVSEYTAKLALQRREAGRGAKVTVVTKQNVFTKTDGMFRSIAEEVLTRAGLEQEHYFVDDACRRLVAHPETFSVLLTPNLFGDIMSDITAELVGGMGMAPSGCIGERHAYFEGVHGSAPDIAGKGIANPLATILSMAMMLDHLGQRELASRVDAAVNRLLEDRKVLPPDLGGSAKTDQVVKALIALL